tara:strand:- start:161 stop:622 length:462 start_codon:yes stop_codon:yes gene_type:complete
MIIDHAVIMAFFADNPSRQKIDNVCRYLGITERRGKLYDRVKSLLRSLATQGRLVVDQRAPGCHRYYSLPQSTKKAARPAAVDALQAVDQHVAALRRLVDEEGVEMEKKVDARNAIQNQIEAHAARIRRALDLLRVLDPGKPEPSLRGLQEYP